MVGMMRRLATLLAGLCLAVGLAAEAGAACPSRLQVRYGDTLSSIARTCGVNVQSLLRLNPGLTPETLRAGTAIAVPAPALPSTRMQVGRPSVQVAPPLVPPAYGAPTIGGAPSTVILPPQVPPVPQQHILRGFGDLPGQLPLPPGHVGTMPGNLLPHQRY